MLNSRIANALHCRISILLLSVFTLRLTAHADTFQKYPFPADFDIRTVRYEWGDIPALSMNIINSDTRAFDSLDVKLYFRSPDGLENDFGALADICIIYRSDGFQDQCPASLSIRERIMQSRPVKMEDTFNPDDSTHVYTFSVPLYGIVMSSQGRFRIDLLFSQRSQLPPYEDLMNQPPDHIISDADWSFGPHHVADGDLVESPGVDVLSKEAVDADFWELPQNYYVTIHRFDELLWGIPPDWESYYDKDSFIPEDTRPEQDPMPYEPIAVPFDEFEARRTRDSANIRISRIRVNQAGYRPGDRNFFYFVGDNGASFSIVNADDGNTVHTGTVSSTGYASSGQMEITGCKGAHLVSGGEIDYVLTGDTVSGAIYEGVIPDLPEGKYRVVIDTMVSAPFVIRKDVYNMVKHALLKFYGINRCGDSQSWFHGACHTQDAVTGGWHDCGDHLKEGATMSYTAAVLGLAAAVFSDVDQDVYAADQSKTLQTDGIPDILYEAKHGADFILQSYDRADGQVGDMVTSIGGFGNPGCGDDHMWWGRPEDQDMLPEERGGPPRCVRSEPTSDYLGKYAANLAFISKQYRQYDASYADRCLEAAKAIYDFTKDRRDLTNTSAYNGSTVMNDDIAFGCLALLWATGERQYLDGLCFDTTIGEKSSSQSLSKVGFEGGWFAHTDPIFTTGMANTGWATTHTHVLWGFYRLVLADKSFCETLGLTEEERLSLIEKCVYTMISKLSSVSNGSVEVAMPDADSWIAPTVKYALPWATMHTQMEWVWNKYHAGNCTDLYYYYDIASDITGTELPHTSSSTDWKAPEIKELLLRSMHYLFGINPWDICMVSGIGAKNLNHPHHRAANPELSSSMIVYTYRHLVGALTGGHLPSVVVYSEHADEYHYSEVGIESTTNLLMPVIGLNTTDISVRNHRHRAGVRLKNTPVRLVTGSKNGTVNVSADKPIREISVFMVSGRRVAHVCPGLRKNILLKLSDSHRAASAGIYVVNVILSDGECISGKVTTALSNRRLNLVCGK
jgi:hypothetical protein